MSKNTTDMNKEEVESSGAFVIVVAIVVSVVAVIAHICGCPWPQSWMLGGIAVLVIGMIAVLMD